MSDNPESNASGTASPSGKRSWLGRLGPPALIVLALALIFALNLDRFLSLATIAEHRDALKAFVSDRSALAVFGFVAVYAVLVAISFPGAAFLTVAAGILFGGVLGAVLAIIGATIGATAIFLVAKSSLGDFLLQRAGPYLDRLRKGFAEDALSYLLFLRLVPLFPFWLVNLAPAFLGVPLRTYLLATVIGIIPGGVAYAYVGAALDSVIAKAAQDPAYQECLAAQGRPGDTAEPCMLAIETGALATHQIFIALAALGVLALIPVAAKRLRRKSRTNGA